MSTLFWNCRGLDNPQTVQALLDLVQMKKPIFVFLLEMMCNKDRVESIRAKMNYEGLYTVAGPGHGGGLALFWKQDGKIMIKAFFQNFIDAEVKLDNMEPWRLTCYYGFPERSRRRESWNLLRNLAAQSSLPWVILGDINDILRDTKKKGRNKQPNWMIIGFKDAMFDCGVSNLPLEGYHFTWERSKGTDRWVEEMLDRVFVSDEWRDRFPTNNVQNLVAPSSDHFAFYFQVQIWKLVPRRSRFRFKNS